MKEDEIKKQGEGITNQFAMIWNYNAHVETQNNYYGGMESSSKTEDEEGIDTERLANAIVECQKYFWANSSYAVVFCLCRDEYGIEDNKSAFEDWVESLPYKSNRAYMCTKNTISSAFSNGRYYDKPIEKWKDLNVPRRVTKLLDELRKCLE